MTAIESPPQRARSPWQRLYAKAHDLRARWYRGRAERLPRPVISLGNLHWGGTGKTPITAAMALHLHQRALRVAILSRGYKRRGRGVTVVSRGGGPLVDPWIGGDEPFLLAEKALGSSVLVAERRAAAGRQALAVLQPRPDIFLLDDGFSHLSLARDIDLLILPRDDPYGGGRLAPSGRLREPLASAARAHAVLLAGGTSEEARDVARALSDFGFQGPGFAVRLVNPPPRMVSGKPLPRGTRVLVVSGIARPQRFLESVERSGVEISGSISFHDHHAYPSSSLQVIEGRARTLGADVVLTTAKDRIKLAGRLTLGLAELDLEARPEAAFYSWIDNELDRLRQEGEGE